MRKLTIVLSLAAVAASSGCCNCGIGRCRNLFHKGSPCGTTVAPAVLGAPLAMGTPMAAPVAVPYSQPMVSAPMMSAPMCVEQAPMCVPCPQQCVDPCADPCASGAVSMGYMGGYTSEGYTSGDACCDGSAGMSMPMESGAVITMPQGTAAPGPLPE
ncbi:MAG: hypothetical protein H0T51_13435 [Pirellulales bacterium]|nr:hypothetical protein [Pirellulales bacterium]